MEELAVRVRDVSKSYGISTVIDGLDLDIAFGEIFALLGPNGAGKSTMVEILEGLRIADRGEISVLRVNPAAGDRRWRSRIGIVAQAAADGAELTVREFVRHIARCYPRPVTPTS